MNRLPCSLLLKRMAVGIICSVFISPLAVSSYGGVVTASAYAPITATPKVSSSPTSPAIVSETPTPIIRVSVTVTTSPDYLLDGLTAGYVLLTLALAIIAFISLSKTQASLDLTRQQIELNKQQSKEASEASELHSQATIEAVNRQISASEKQAQEALYNQHKPVIVPLTQQLAFLRGENVELNMQNKGSGVALNTFCLLTIYNSHNILCSNKVYFLVPGLEELILFSLVHKEAKFPYNVFEGYNIFSSEVRFMVTYNDAFGNKYLAVYDYSSALGWRQIDEIKRVGQRLDEKVVINH